MDNKYNFMSIGSNCCGILALGPERIKGPLDNVKCILDKEYYKKLFTGELEEHILSTAPIITDVDFDSFKTNYDYELVEIQHNNPLEEKFKIEFKKRFQNLYNFYKNIHKSNNYFLYSLGACEVNYESYTFKNKEIFDNFIDWLKENNIYNKTVFLGQRKIDIKKSYWNFAINDIYNLYPDIKYLEITDVSFDNGEYQKSGHTQFLQKIGGVM